MQSKWTIQSHSLNLLLVYMHSHLHFVRTVIRCHFFPHTMQNRQVGGEVALSTKTNTAGLGPSDMMPHCLDLLSIWGEKGCNRYNYRLFSPQQCLYTLQLLWLLNHMDEGKDWQLVGEECAEAWEMANLRERQNIATTKSNTVGAAAAWAKCWRKISHRVNA